jgi:hypothetical protein
MFSSYSLSFVVVKRTSELVSSEYILCRVRRRTGPDPDGPVVSWIFFALTPNYDFKELTGFTSSFTIMLLGSEAHLVSLNFACQRNVVIDSATVTYLVALHSKMKSDDTRELEEVRQTLHTDTAMQW